MARVKLADIEAGMVLKTDVQTSNGQMLMPAGATVNEKHIKTFKTWGINLIEIVSDDDAELDKEFDLSSVDSDLVDDCRAKIKMAYKFLDLSHPLIQCLFEQRLRRDILQQVNRGQDEA